MKNVLTEFNPIIENKLQINHYKFKVKDMIGSWQLDFISSSEFSSYKIILYKNLTWESIDFYSNNVKLAGYWNIYQDIFDTTSAIHGYGNKIWLWMRRFGKLSNKSEKIHIEQDRLYTGKIIKFNKYYKPTKIYGHVSIGWTLEPDFIGTFTLKSTFL